MPQQFIAVDNVCAWPNLTLLRDGALVATIFNQPCHGLWEGDVECWASEDGGALWQYRGTPAPHEPGTNRMNVAAGLAKDGDLVVLASGWGGRPPKGEKAPHLTEYLLGVRPWICRSRDGGRTWAIDKTSFPSPAGANVSPFIPFGDVLEGADGTLGASAYTAQVGPDGKFSKQNSSFFLRSRDDGRTWGEVALLGEGDYNETAPFHLGGGRWLAAARTAKDGHLDLFRSEDNGATWRREQTLSLPNQHPAHLARLADGRLLLTYGLRCPGQHGVGARLSKDDGLTWGAPATVVSYPAADGGYPASVQRPDGKIVTAFYAASQPQHQRYHMGVALWDVTEFFNK